MISSLTSPPWSIIFLACLPRSVPCLTCSRSMSPVARWQMWCASLMLGAWVPLPVVRQLINVHATFEEGSGVGKRGAAELGRRAPADSSLQRFPSDAGAKPKIEWRPNQWIALLQPRSSVDAFLSCPSTSPSVKPSKTCRSSSHLPHFLSDARATSGPSFPPAIPPLQGAAALRPRRLGIARRRLKKRQTTHRLPEDPSRPSSDGARATRPP
jgi:hypothetical protein